MKLPRRQVLTSAAALVGGQVTLAAAQAKFDLKRQIEQAIAKGVGVIRLPAGRFETEGITIEQPLRIEGVPGQTILVTRNGAPAILAMNTSEITLFGLSFDGSGKAMTDQLPGLVVGWRMDRLLIDECTFINSDRCAVKLEQCGGRVANCNITKAKDTGILVIDSKAMRISQNEVSDIGNNGIQVWRTKLEEDGTQVVDNHVSKIRMVNGGNGQNGNGIAVFSAGNVLVANNRIHDTAYSGIRCNSGSNIQIIGNSVSRSAETAIYAEFKFQGAVIANNVVENGVHGIAITNFNEGGRLAVCTGNLVRGMKGGGSNPDASDGVGIHCEADTLVANNVLEDIETLALSLGWGEYARNISAQGNIIRKSGRGIGFSVLGKEGKILIAGNIIEDVVNGAIVGMNHGKPATGDFLKSQEKPPAGVSMYGNMTTGG